MLWVYTQTLTWTSEMDDFGLMLSLGKYIYNGGLTGVIFWLLYDMRMIKMHMQDAIKKKDVTDMIASELALVKQDQSYVKEQLNRIEGKLDKMIDDIYLPRVRKE